MNNHKELKLEQLLVACRERDDLAFSELVERYTPMIRGVISGFSSGQDSFDELFAEGCVALHSAAMNFDIRQTQVTFGLYARICVYNRMVDFIRFEKKSEEVVDYDVDTVADDGTSIEAGILGRETVEQLLKKARALLSDYEYSVLMYHIQGYKTSQIARCLGRDSKSIDNAKWRIFKRLRAEVGSIGDFN